VKAVSPVQVTNKANTKQAAVTSELARRRNARTLLGGGGPRIAARTSRPTLLGSR